MPEKERTVNIIKFINAEAQVTFLPSRRHIRIPVLQYLAGQLELGRDYTGQEAITLLGQRLCGLEADVLRRVLIDEGLLARTPDGARYWRQPFPQRWSIRRKEVS